MATGSTIEAITGLAAIVLTALALAQFLPSLLLTIAIIVVGAGLFLRGGAAAAEYSKLVRESGNKVTAGASPSGGASAELIAGVVGIVLGVLTLFGIVPQVLAAVALVVLAVGLMMNSVTNARLSKLRLAMLGVDGPIREASTNAVWADSATQVLVGIGAIVLGALALLGFSPVLLTVIGILALGVMETLSGGGLTSRAFGLSRLGSARRDQPEVPEGIVQR